MARFQPVISDRYPYLDLRVQIRDWQDETYALVDTGYTGNLVVPERLWTQELGQADGRINLIVADGGIVRAPVYLGDIELFGIPVISGLRVVFMGDEFILGRGIIDRFKVTFDHGQRIIVEP